MAEYLLVSIAIAEQLRAPWMLANLVPVRRKLTASFSPSHRRRIEALKARIRVGPAASLPVMTGLHGIDASVADTLCRASFEQTVLALSCSDTTG